MLRNAISIWRQSDSAEALEGIEDDPVFKMMINALAYESNEIDADINKFRQDIFEDFSSMLMPYGIGGAIPSTVAVTMMPQPGIASVRMSDSVDFVINGTSYSMIPLLESVVFNLTVASLRRLDGRRWALSLDFPTSVSDLSGLTFAIGGAEFSGLKLFSEDGEVALVSPWDFADMPYSGCFSFDGMLFNHTPIYNPSNACMDLFARQNLRLFYVRSLKLPQAASHLELVLEFEGVDTSFVFRSDNFIPNAVILVNAKCKDVTLDSMNPVFRLEDNKSLMHLIRPEDDQIFGNTKVLVRRVESDRFNEAALIKLFRFLINRFNTDYYAFMSYNESEIDDLMTKLRMMVEHLSRSLEEKAENKTAGVYLILGDTSKKKQLSVDVHYVVTDAENCNAFLNQNTKFIAPDTVEEGSIKIISTPVPGFSDLSFKTGKMERARYYMSCNDRIVTPADIKVFCYTILMSRFGVTREMIENVGVSRIQDSSSATGYSIAVNIELKDSRFIKDLASGISSARTIIEKMLSVRSTGIYPIRLDLKIVK